MTDLPVVTTDPHGALTGRDQSIEDVLRRSSGVAHRSVILAAGFTPYELGRAKHSGRIWSVRRSWYALPGAPTPLVQAVRVGGALTGGSLAALLGLWVLDDGRVHVSLAKNASRMRSRDDKRSRLDLDRADVCLHWRKASGETLEPIETLASALLHALECQPEEHAVAMMDSALERGLVQHGELTALAALLPRRYRRAVAAADRRAQAGTETMVRMRLRRLGIAVRLQVKLPGGRVDLLIGDRLIIECDSRMHHTDASAYQRDRARDLIHLRHGYLVVRLTYADVVHDWPRVVAAILDIIRRNDHCFPRFQE